MIGFKKLKRQILYAADQASFSVACDIEVCERLGIKMGSLESKAWRIRCFLRGFFVGLSVSI